MTERDAKNIRLVLAQVFFSKKLMGSTIKTNGMPVLRHAIGFFYFIKNLEERVDLKWLK